MKTCSLVIAMVGLVGFVSGCGSEPAGDHVDAVYLYTPEARVAPHGGECVVTLAATTAWAAHTTAEWIRVDPCDGVTGFTAVTISYDANMSGLSRSGSVSFVGGGHTAVFKLTQDK